MNAMFASLVPALGWALIDFLWQGALVGLATAIALILLRNARPQVRYALCCGALALCLALPVVGVLQGVHPEATTGVSPASRFVQFAVVPDQQTVVTAPTAAWQSAFQIRLSWIVVFWSLGAGLLAARMAVGMTWVARAGRSQGLPHPRWQRRLDRLAETLGIQCAVRLRVVADLATPVAAGCWKPIVLVPAALIAKLPLDLVEALLAHELAHVRRHDYLVNLIQSAIEALLFYHPVVWWLSKRIRVEREEIADDLAALALGEPRRLALALHELDRFQEEMRRTDHGLEISTTSLIPAANGGHLMSRIQRLIRPNQHALSWNIALPIIGLTALCLTVHAHDTPPAVAAAAATAPVAPIVVAASAAPAVPMTVPAPVIASVMATAATAPTVASTMSSSTQVVHSSDHDESDYAIVSGSRDGMSMHGDTRDIPAIESVKLKVHGDFIWVRRNNKAYVVVDPATVAAVIAAMQPVQALGKQLEAMGAQMDGPGKHMEALGKQMDSLSDGSKPFEAAMEKDSARMEELGRQQEVFGSKLEALGDKMGDASDDAARNAIERQMRTLEEQMKPIEQQMEALGKTMEQRGEEMETAHKPMEDLGRRMEAESKPMETLGKQMEALGRQEEQLSKQADQKVNVLIDEAMRSGKIRSTDALR